MSGFHSAHTPTLKPGRTGLLKKVSLVGGVRRSRPTPACEAPLLCHTGADQYPVFEYRTGCWIKSSMTRSIHSQEHHQFLPKPACTTVNKGSANDHHSCRSKPLARRDREARSRHPSSFDSAQGEVGMTQGEVGMTQDEVGMIFPRESGHPVKLG